MKTPINGARLSSLNEEASILGYNKMHRGTDFAAPVELQLWLQVPEQLLELDGAEEGQLCKNKT